MQNKIRPNVFVSSTYEDLIAHRQAVRDVLLTLGFYPVMMEYFSSIDAGTVEKCLLDVDEANIYVGIFAHRYGYCPEGSEISITEMEFDRASKNGIPRLCFLIDESYPWTPQYIDSEPNKNKLSVFKSSKIDYILRSKFTTPESLALKVAVSLMPYLFLAPDSQSLTHESSSPNGLELASPFVLAIEIRVATDEIVLCANRLTQLTNQIGKDMNEREKEMREVQIDNSLFVDIVKATCENILCYAVAVKGQNQVLGVYWTIFALRLIKLTSLADMDAEDDIAVLKIFKGQLEVLRDSISSTVTSLIGLHNSFNDLNSFNEFLQKSKYFDFDYALRLAQETVSETIEELKNGIEAAQAIINKISDLLS
jgi:hypothetical protein